MADFRHKTLSEGNNNPARDFGGRTQQEFRRDAYNTDQAVLSEQAVFQQRLLGDPSDVQGRLDRLQGLQEAMAQAEALSSTIEPGRRVTFDRSASNSNYYGYLPNAIEFLRNNIEQEAASRTLRALESSGGGLHLLGKMSKNMNQSAGKGRGSQGRN